MSYSGLCCLGSVVPALFPAPCVIRNTGTGGLAGSDVRESKSKHGVSFGLKYHCRESAETAS